MDLISGFDFFVVLCDALRFQRSSCLLLVQYCCYSSSKELEGILDEEFLNVVLNVVLAFPFTEQTAKLKQLLEKLHMDL